ncbi:hypothetical protein GALMADRAFT_162350 [Galerina marginata CBS 339.88]|uniref:Uncharacterized protein n=1 Tax=Galerina marginata (strain CBS 339.88) TaxID=685588 RepID=A0A067S7H9_GALM3|nr:hypothetical protein GALMADRAFT_162350 [Galerina marginata CBS 339.88]
MNVAGTDLSTKQLLLALKWRLDHDDDVQDLIHSSQSGAYEREVAEQLDLANYILSKMRVRGNALLHVNRIPVELLALIFELTQDLKSPCFPPETNDEIRDSNSWLTVTHVCQHWRRIVISVPSLWQNIFLGLETKHQDELRDMFASRTGTIAINLTQNFKRQDFISSSSAYSIAKLRVFLVNHQSRLRSLHLSSEAVKISKEIWGLLEDEFPALESLHLRFGSEVHGVPGMRGKLSKILGGRPSNLRRLSLHHISSWPYNLQTFSQLTHLSLRSQLRDRRPAFSAFLEMLEGCPLLQIIVLHDAGPLRDNAHLSYTGRSVRLAFLQRIEISWTTSPDSQSPHHLLKSLDTPQETAALVSSAYLFHASGLPYIDFYLPPESWRHQITTLQIRRSGDEALLLQEALLSIDTRTAMELYFPFIPMRFTNITSIIISIPFMISPTILQKIAQFPALTMIRFDYPFDYVLFIEALRSPRPGAEGVMCPILQEFFVPKLGEARFPRHQAKLMQYQCAGISEIDRSHLNMTSFKVIIRNCTDELLSSHRPMRRIIKYT